MRHTKQIIRQIFEEVVKHTMPLSKTTHICANGREKHSPLVSLNYSITTSTAA